MTPIGIRHLTTGFWWRGPLYAREWSSDRDEAAVFSSASQAIAIALTRCPAPEATWRWQRLPERES